METLLVGPNRIFPGIFCPPLNFISLPRPLSFQMDTLRCGVVGVADFIDERAGPHLMAVDVGTVRMGGGGGDQGSIERLKMC